MTLAKTFAKTFAKTLAMTRTVAFCKWHGMLDVPNPAYKVCVALSAPIRPAR